MTAIRLIIISLQWLIVAVCLISPVAGYACPQIGGFIDYNCDGELRVSVFGDSFVYGFGDTANGNRGGYVLRAARQLPAYRFQNLGLLGDNSVALLARLKKALEARDSDDSTYRALIDADVIFIDTGRNDRWFFGPPSQTQRNLRQISNLINTEVRAITGIAPMVITSVLMLPNRGSQGPWVKELNTLIQRSNSKSHPADLRFDLVSKRLIGSDQIHPTSQGYTALAKTFVNYMRRGLARRLSSLRPDKDGDGLYDFFEVNRYGTLSDNPDTDGDGKSDGDEVLFLKTDPLVAD